MPRVVALLVAIASVAISVDHANAADRPNIVFIITDDQAPETLSCYGNTVCKTPNIDRLAADGIVLDDAHHMGAWVGAVCTCSRTMIMTGRTLWHIPGKATKNGSNGPGTTKEQRLEAANNSLPAVFNRAGYDTFRTCKRGNSFDEANKLFQVVHDKSSRGGKEPGSEWHGDRAIEYLKERQADGDSDPFLMYFGFSHPHDPRNGPEDLVAKYGANNSGPQDSPNPSAPPLPINWLPKHPFHHGHPGLRDEVAVQGVMRKRDEATVRNETGREYACIENIDRQVGRLLDQLEAMGQLDNTYIFYTADHGIAVGRHGLMGKQNLYEHTWRVPMIVRGPGIKPGSRASGFTYLLDSMATMCDFAGIEPPETNEGISFRPVLEGKEDRIRDVVYGCYCGGTKPGMRSVKTAGRWKLIEYDVKDGDGNRIRETQVFNLNTNPNEFLVEHLDNEVTTATGHTPRTGQQNLAENEKLAAKRSELEQLLKAEMQQLEDPYEL